MQAFVGKVEEFVRFDLTGRTYCMQDLMQVLVYQQSQRLVR